MNKQLQLGLVIEGNSTTSEILKLPSLVEELGPVKSGSIRVARRQSNLIKAGYPVVDYEDLQPAGLILLKLADSSATRVAGELCASGLCLEGLSFVLCESWLPAKVLKPLAERGASIATTLRLPTNAAPWFIVEGETRAVRQMRRLFSRNSARSVELNPDCKHLVFASQLLATAVPIVLLAEAKHLLRDCGIPGKIPWSMVDQMARKMILDFSRSARAESTGPLAVCPPETRQTHMEDLAKTMPRVAENLRHQLRSVLEVTPQGGEDSP